MVICIRKFKESDVASLVVFTNNPNVVRYLPLGRFPNPYAESDGKAFVSQAIESPQMIAYAITADDVCIGAIGALINEEPSCQHSAELGYWLAEEFWGKGIMSTALRLFLKEIEGRFIRLWAEVVEENIASMEMLKKQGFLVEGLFRKSFHRADEFRNTYILARVQ